MTGPGNRETPHYAETPRRGIDSFADGRRSWQAYAEHLEARCVRAEEVAERIKNDSERDTHRTYGEAHMYEVGRRDAAVAILSALAAVPEKNRP